MDTYKSSNVDWKEDFRYANKELRLTRKELEYQKIYAQAAFELYDESTQVAHSMMVIKGISIELWSELHKWEKRNNSENEGARERLATLDKHINQIASVQTDNYALRWNAGQTRRTIWELMEENKNLKHQLYLHTLNNSDIPEDRI